jgi:hypothetical protein
MFSIIGNDKDVIKAYAEMREKLKDDFVCGKDLFLIGCGDGREVYVCADDLDEVEEFLERWGDHICR